MDEPNKPDKANSELDANFIPGNLGLVSESLEDNGVVTCTRGSSSIYVEDELRSMPVGT